MSYNLEYYMNEVGEPEVPVVPVAEPEVKYPDADNDEDAEGFNPDEDDDDDEENEDDEDKD